jgi:hypothetical protein
VTDNQISSSASYRRIIELQGAKNTKLRGVVTESHRAIICHGLVVGHSRRYDGLVLWRGIIRYKKMKPTWFDWITVVAIVLGPVLALFAQRGLDWLREKKNRRMQIYLTLMSLRATWLNPDSIRALNSLDTIFAKRTDKPVREAWAKVLTHVNTPRRNPNDEQESIAWNNRLLDLRVDLYQAVGAAVGYDHSIDYIKTQFYQPQYHVEVEREQEQIRKQFAKAITDAGLKVVIAQADIPPPTQPGPAPHPRVPAPQLPPPAAE